MYNSILNDYRMESYALNQRIEFYKKYFEDKNLKDPYEVFKEVERKEKIKDVPLKKEYRTTYIKPNGEIYTSYTEYEPKIEYTKEFLKEPYKSDPFYTSAYYNCYWHKVISQYIQYQFYL